MKKKAREKTTLKNTGNKLLPFVRSNFLSLFFLFLIFISFLFTTPYFTPAKQIESKREDKYWLVLYRQSNLEQLFMGIPGDYNQSKLIKTFKVKTGIPGQRPTPLPQSLNRQYWVITQKSPTENPETAPYFIELDVPVTDEPPYGPVPYDECNGQCNWELPGAFGLHGVNGDNTRLSNDNPGSSGCIRHTDEDIKYLYSIIEPSDNVRYYIKDI